MKPSRTLPILGLAFLSAIGLAQIQRAPKQVPYQVIQTGQYSNVRNQTLVEITDARTFRQYWSRNFNQQEGTEPQGINWVTDRIVVLNLGRQNTTGYRFFVSNVEQGKDGQPIVRMIAQPPVPGSFVGQSVTSPWVMLKVANNYRGFKMSVATKDRFNGNLIVTPGATDDRNGGGACSCNGGCSCGCGCGGR